MKKLYTVLAAALAVAMGASAASPLKSLDKVNIKRDFTVKSELTSALKANDAKSLMRKAAKASEGITAEDIRLPLFRLFTGYESGNRISLWVGQCWSCNNIYNFNHRHCH